MAGKGRRFELELKNGIMDNTPNTVYASGVDYSGNSKFSVADITVFYDDTNVTSFTSAFIEAKKRRADSGNRATVMSGSSTGDSGLDELTKLVEGTPPWARSILAVKFPNKELIPVDAAELLYYLTEDCDYEYEHIKPRLTPSDNISMVNPEMIASQRSGDPPWEVICNVLELPTNE